MIKKKMKRACRILLIENTTKNNLTHCIHFKEFFLMFPKFTLKLMFMEFILETKYI